MFIVIAEEIGSRKACAFAQAQKSGCLIADEDNYVVYKFMDGSEILFQKTKSGTVKTRSYTIYN